VFENLLAAHIPETRTTARKRTGSYYTPRPVVDYMVDEALARSLAEVCRRNGSNHVSETLLRQLLDHGHEQDPASLPDDVRKAGVEAVATIKILDPAVGSGAFPMSILHKLTLVLRRLDPDNQLWEQFQRQLAVRRAEEALQADEQAERDQQLLAISDTFGKYRESDFGRKLYLIQNSIYGVDIQPIACQIAKLRFFIALAIEQEPDRDAENRGIKPLPNLETRFVAANTLLALCGQQQLSPTRVAELEAQLRSIRERYFHASTRALKQECIAQDGALRRELAEALRDSVFDLAAADAFVQWRPYDQSTTADWFDHRYMFNAGDGFDIVIGNPPYVRADVDAGHLAQRARITNSGLYETLWEKWDLYIPFIERGYKLLNAGGFITLIVSDAYCHAKYAQKSQKWFLENSRIVQLDFLSKIKVFDAAVRNMTFLFQNSTAGQDDPPLRRVHEGKVGNVRHLPTSRQTDLNHRAFFPEDMALDDFTIPTVTLETICYISVGIVGERT